MTLISRRCWLEVHENIHFSFFFFFSFSCFVLFKLQNMKVMHIGALQVWFGLVTDFYFILFFNFISYMC